GSRQDGPGDGQPLALPPGQLYAPFPDDRVVPFRQRGNELVGIGAPGGVEDLRVRGAVTAVGDVFTNRAVEQEHLLVDNRQELAVAIEAELANINDVDQDLSNGRLMEACHQVGSGRATDA